MDKELKQKVVEAGKVGAALSEWAMLFLEDGPFMSDRAFASRLEVLSQELELLSGRISKLTGRTP